MSTKFFNFFFVVFCVSASATVINISCRKMKCNSFSNKNFNLVKKHKNSNFLLYKYSFLIWHPLNEQ
ncbi:hypothetical protein BW900_24595 [Bacillus mycoides]|uniref:Secreted protein n=1 Tax=Bacillus mycoides TaxID=1405 RepID=A0A1S9T1Q0_BACMY|nr:hypothetical protein BW900_24595 [Bacillus mycoides]